MDAVIVSYSIGAFISFCLLHAVVFRLIPSSAVISGLTAVYVFIAVCQSAAIFLFSPYTLDDKILLVLLTLFIFSLLSLTYILALFGIIASSVRIRILHEIARTGEVGTSVSGILERYNRRVIVQNRLERLVASNLLRFDGRAYHIRIRFTLYSLIELLFRFAWRVYGGKEKK